VKEDFAVSESGSSTSEARLVNFENGVYTVEGAIQTPASLEEVLSVLTDYEGLSAVFSNIKSSAVASRHPEIVLRQDCKWEFLIFSGKFRAELGVKEDLQRRCLTFSLITSTFMKNFVGRWQIQPHASGGCTVQHRLAVEPLVSPPALMTSYTQKIFVRQVAKILKDLEQEMALRSSADFQYLDL